ncbi:MAG: hydantoinase B/oxoprolinase family protein [Gammaproteobacteria bacterium]|nr:hydantoinase B/oxoprolinase family protein [Gammaproteobacteria bacterium]MCF6229568.1 hydantoinase B/oxoprolinase family protein [Gammaproteobacteria bacterium]
MNAIELNIFSSRVEAVCDEMGAVLRRSAFSPNIKERLDYSCAIFNREGELCAQAAHIPVHLGSMAYAMRDIVNKQRWEAGDMVILNDPYLGGTHLPDITLIAPVFVNKQLSGFVVNRAHHADIGADAPGSMPLSTHLDQEGVVIPPTRLLCRGVVDDQIMHSILSALHNGERARGDFLAQISANRRGVERLSALITRMGEAQFVAGLDELNEYAARLSRVALRDIPDGEYQFTDLMDDDGHGQQDIVIHCSVRVKDGQVTVDFSGTSAQVAGNINAPLSVAAASVYYVFRCLMPVQTPACAGSFRHIRLQAPAGSLLNARYPAAVAAGNVETSTRVVDVVMGALAQAIPQRIPAASHGSMNNLAMGSREAVASWDYYETMGGGMGASIQNAGQSAVQTHMTNTLNTPIEALEMSYPLRVRRYAIRRHSGGAGQRRGGDGLVREFEFLKPASFTLLSERRRHRPWGLKGGLAGLAGKNQLNGQPIEGKVHGNVQAGDRLLIETAGGGGWGPSKQGVDDSEKT